VLARGSALRFKIEAEPSHPEWAADCSARFQLGDHRRELFVGGRRRNRLCQGSDGQAFCAGSCQYSDNIFLAPCHRLPPKTRAFINTHSAGVECDRVISPYGGARRQPWATWRREMQALACRLLTRFRHGRAHAVVIVGATTFGRSGRFGSSIRSTRGFAYRGICRAFIPRPAPADAERSDRAFVSSTGCVACSPGRDR
jgi:hypothetical protein